MKNLPIEFKVGDIVEAKERIWRRDGRAELLPGEKAEVFRIFRVSIDSPQIIDLKIKNGFIIGDIVCFENVPLEKIN